MQPVGVPTLNIGFGFVVIQISFVNRCIDFKRNIRGGKRNGQKTDNLRVLPN